MKLCIGLTLLNLGFLVLHLILGNSWGYIANDIATVICGWSAYAIWKVGRD